MNRLVEWLRRLLRFQEANPDPELDDARMRLMRLEQRMLEKEN